MSRKRAYLTLMEGLFKNHKWVYLTYRAGLVMSRKWAYLTYRAGLVMSRKRAYLPSLPQSLVMSRNVLGMNLHRDKQISTLFEFILVELKQLKFNPTPLDIYLFIYTFLHT